MTHNQLQEPLEAPFKSICKQTGNHLDTILRRRQLSLYSRTGRGLEDISIKTLRSTADAGPLGLHFIKISHHSESLLAHERCREWYDGTRRPHTNQCAGLVVHQIVDIDLTFNKPGTGMDRLSQAIQSITHNG